VSYRVRFTAEARRDLDQLYDFLLERDLNAAEEAFRASLVRAPNNGWALYGLGEVYRRMGRADAVTEVTRRLDAAWAGDRDVLVLERL